MIKLSRINIPFDELDKRIDKGEVDTLSLHIPIKKWLQDEFICKEVLNKIKSVSEMIKSELKIKTEIIEDIYYNSNYTEYLEYQQCEYTLYTFSYRCLTGYLTITLPHLMVQGRNENSIIKELKDAMEKHFNIPHQYLDNVDNYILLSRIDYKRDYRYHSLEEYYLIRQVIDIAPEYISRGYYKKTTITDTKNAFIKVYKSESNKTVEFTIYNKDKEQLQKYKKGKISKYQYDDFQNVIRFEVKFKNAKLNALKYTGISKDIDNYKERYTARGYFSQYSKQAFFTETFYRIDIAKRMVRKSNLKSNMKDKLCELLENINKFGYTYTREHYSNYTKFSRHINILRGLGINPLTFRTSWLNDKRTSYKELCNFTLADNCLEEEYVIC